LKETYTIGIDFGTLSARAVVVSCKTGKVISESVVVYSQGVITGTLPDGTRIPESYALAWAQDYRQALINSVKGAVEKSGVASDIIGIGIDATTYTMIPCLKDGTVLSELDEFCAEPMAYIKLWKHQGAKSQAERIEAFFKQKGFFPVLKRYGGTCNCEFAVPKLLETYEKAPHVFEKADVICDLGEWLSLLLTGHSVHSVFSAGFKSMWHEEFGWPEKEQLEELSPGFGEGLYAKFAGELNNFERPCGYLTAKMAELLGLRAGIPVATPMGDGSTPGVYFCIKEPNAVAITVGTSIAVAFADDKKHEIDGINGVTFGGIVPGRWSYDAGTPCAGDMLDWFCKFMVPKETFDLAAAENKGIHTFLSEKASRQPWSNPLSVLDWWNGNRSVLNDMSLRGSILGLGLSTDTADMYGAFIQSIACSIRTILKHLDNNGLHFEEIILCGGMPGKNRFLVEQIASILGKRVKVSNETQLTAVSSAILGAVAAGIDIHEAVQHMTSSEYAVIESDTTHRTEYDVIYHRWKRYHDVLSSSPLFTYS